MNRSRLRPLLAPRSIAVVGANDRPGSYASQTLLNLAAIGFQGPVWGVNPKRSEVHGRPCVPTVAELPVAVDAVVVAIPAVGVPEVIEQVGARRCGGAVVFSAGFAEAPGGAELQRHLVAAADRHGLPVCGPNCNGIVAMHARSALWGDALAPREPGNVALISQSGNVAVNALATRRGLRFHTVVASGNQAVVPAAEYLEALAAEEEIRAIALYLEDDGGPRLCDGLAACAEAEVPVVVLKVGSSDAGARAAAAHSAALAGDQRVFRGLIEEAGAFWAQDVHELLELCKTLGAGGTPRGGGLAIMTCSGGDSAQGADEVQRSGLELPALAPASRKRLEALLPSAATVANPLDYTAMIWGEREALRDLVSVLGEDPGVDQVLVFYDEPAGLSGDAERSWGAVRDAIVAGAAVSPVPTIVSSTLPELLDDATAWRFAQAGIAPAAGLRTGVRCAAAMAAPRASASEAKRLRAIAAAARTVTNTGSAGEWLSEHDAKELLRAGGGRVVEGHLVRDEDEAAAALPELGGRIALKLCGTGIRHKTELGGIELELTTEAYVRRAYRRLGPLAARHEGNAAVLAERMADPGVELLIAAHTDGVVPALILGLGGIWTELLEDVAVIPLPAGAARVERALRSLRAAPLLTGGRGSPKADLQAAAELAALVGQLLLERDLELLECNPAIIGSPGGGAVVVDATARRRVLSAAPAESADAALEGSHA